VFNDLAADLTPEIHFDEALFLVSHSLQPCGLLIVLRFTVLCSPIVELTHIPLFTIDDPNEKMLRQMSFDFCH